MSARTEREIVASDQSNVYDNWHKMRVRLRHVFESPNTFHYRRIFDDLIRQDVRGKKVLEIGCGNGAYSKQLLSLGATYVLGVDVSRKRIAEAQTQEIVGQLEFSVADASEPVDGVFDIIVGHAVLHHLDYKDVLLRLYQHNLNSNGMMLFWEPLGANALLKAYHAFGKSLHTPDERPFYRRDLRWLKQNFSNFKMLPVNYLSLPLGILSSFVFADPDNVMLRAADKVDRFLANNVAFLHANFRNAIFFIRKPSYDRVSFRS